MLGVLTIWPLVIAIAQHTEQPAAARANGAGSARLLASDIVAIVNGDGITAAQLDAELGPQLAQLEDQRRRLRQTMLLKLIDNALIQQAARREGLNVEEYLRRNVENAAVSDQEVEENYQRSRSRFLAALEPEAKYRVRRELEDRRRSDALRGLLERLRREAYVTNYLLEGLAPELASGSPPSLGRADAAITIIEFCDFACPFCRKAQPVIRDTIAKWGSNVRLIFRHFPLPKHPNAFDAAKAAVCADRASRFWAYMEMLFQGPDLSGPGLVAHAQASGLIESEFADCVKRADTAAVVRQDIDLGIKAGVDGTPAIFVNGMRLAHVGQLDSAIQNELRRRGLLSQAAQ